MTSLNVKMALHAGDLDDSGHDIVASGGGALNDLSDVNAPTPTDQDVLTWDNGTSKWIAQAGGGGGLTHPQVLARSMGS